MPADGASWLQQPRLNERDGTTAGEESLEMSAMICCRIMSAACISTHVSNKIEALKRISGVQPLLVRQQVDGGKISTAR